MKKKILSLTLALMMCLGLFIVPAYADGGGGMIESLNGEYYLLNYGGNIWFIDQNGKDRMLSSDERNALNWSWTQNEDGWHTLVLNGCEGKYLSLGLTTHLILSDGSVNTFERVNLNCNNACPELHIEGTGELIATSNLSVFQNSGPITLAENLQMTGGPDRGNNFPLTYDTTARVELSDNSQVPKTSNGTDATYVRIAPTTSASGQPEKPIEQPQQPAGNATASPTNDKLEVNGTAANPTVYKIGDSNYFKIRDVAALLNKSEKQFAVGYDGTKNAVTARKLRLRSIKSTAPTTSSSATWARPSTSTWAGAPNAGCISKRTNPTPSRSNHGRRRKRHRPFSVHQKFTIILVEINARIW